MFAIRDLRRRAAALHLVGLGVIRESIAHKTKLSGSDYAYPRHPSFRSVKTEQESLRMNFASLTCPTFRMPIAGVNSQ